MASRFGPLVVVGVTYALCNGEIFLADAPSRNKGARITADCPKIEIFMSVDCVLRSRQLLRYEDEFGLALDESYSIMLES